MALNREQIANGVITAAIVAGGFASSSPIAVGVIGGIGVNLAANVVEAALGHACKRLFGENGLLNHDLQLAMSRAFQEAIKKLAEEWWKTPSGSQMKRKKL